MTSTVSPILDLSAFQMVETTDLTILVVHSNTIVVHSTFTVGMTTMKTIVLPFLLDFVA